MITKLTPEQEASIPAYRDEWIKLGESTEQSDVAVMRQSVNDLYDVLGLPRVPVLVMDSPMGCVVASNVLRSVPASDNIWANIGANIWDNIRVNIGANIGDNIWANIGDNIDDFSFEYSVSEGNHSIAYTAYANFFETIGHIYPPDLKNKLNVLTNYHSTCGWLYGFESVAFVSNRPTVLNRDENGRLHCETGHAIEYADGYGFCAWHGVQIPTEWVLNKTTIEPSVILKTENVEQRAAGAALLGWPRMLSALNAKIIHDSGSPDMGQLIELTLPGLPKPGRFLKAHCPRNGIICEGVPYISDIDGLPIDTALAAQAWRIGDPQSEYQHPPMRT